MDPYLFGRYVWATNLVPIWQEQLLEMFWNASDPPPKGSSQEQKKFKVNQQLLHSLLWHYIFLSKTGEIQDYVQESGLYLALGNNS